MNPEYLGRVHAVSIRADTVLKVQDPAASARERRRTEAGREVGQRTGLFIVPEIVSFDDARGEIVFQRLNLTELRRALSTGGRSVELAERAGRAIAAIHGQMNSVDERPPSYVTERGITVPLHGDFGMRNVFYLQDSDRIAIIDWANADWIRIEGGAGAPEIDLAVFLVSLFHRRLFGPWPIARRHEVARRFLAAYQSASPHGVSVEDLRRTVAVMIPAFVQLTRWRKGILHTLACRHAMIDLAFFLRRLRQAG